LNTVGVEKLAFNTKDTTMIDPNTEELITLCQATRLIPSARNGKKTAVSTLFRWASKGVKGIRLETLQVGGAQRTSKQALTRFYQALSAKAGLLTEIPEQSSAAKRQAEIDRAAARVKALVR
jgi:hypothetical protein